MLWRICYIYKLISSRIVNCEYTRSCIQNPWVLWAYKHVAFRLINARSFQLYIISIRSSIAENFRHVRYCLHLHVESKRTAFSNTIRSNIDFSTTFFYDLLDDHQTKAYTLAVNLGCPVKLSKSREKIAKIFLSNANPCIFNLYDQAFAIMTIARSDLNLALFCELECILDQIYHYLLESTNITDKFWEL